MNSQITFSITLVWLNPKSPSWCLPPSFVSLTALLGDLQIQSAMASISKLSTSAFTQSATSSRPSNGSSQRLIRCFGPIKQAPAFDHPLFSSKLSMRSHLPIRASLVVRCSMNDANGTSVKKTTLHDLYEKEGQSPWYDNLCRPVTDLIPLIESGVRGVTSNPAIFQKAISTSSAYNDQFRELVQTGKDIESAYWELVVKDIQDACKLFEPIYDQTDGGDGYVSVEVSPRLADDTVNTIEAAKWLHQWVDRPNVYIKIPATAACIPSIKEVIAQGISVNVTLIFSLARYEAVIDAYLDGLEASGLSDLSRVTSVASFFVSRVDTLVDKVLEKIGTPEALDLRGKAANAQAALAYELYQKKFSGPRWEALVKKGAKKQRLLWASTSVKNPAYPDTLYVAPLIGPDTVSTMPDQALQAFIDHGSVARTIDSNIPEAKGIYSALEKLGVDWSEVGAQLELEGVESFKKSFDSLLDSLQEKANSLKLVSL
ncbi:Aldolase-type TIM barrel family protein [Striga hermonthica]|uniref:Aldolase-type TIM barrel family protein n=1 Tax=Striga hermonthica TaxID=68872 RepID=A0A9N7MN21_STRHE|nr:Aldolase-type TIM barrel family protein [Striga hermonthica]